ncbi:hypothetical protein [Mucilaginibacter sp. BT774]|uniref:hypothetical protein n=1 Tax=Mucilaginibacter sp. BT774 TaxID=3062276 RepID=UPI0026775EAB|nr:hypothetical protein [Mucilaginibacter sp. BT774]MDO3627581.1 hypothetical protein [Mucilaginibacter sp. BT774]
MKRVIIILLMLVASRAFAQDAPSLSDLTISNAPGLILAGKSTISVDKPTTPRAFAISLVNLQQGGAVEISPYWWFDRPNLTYEAFIRRKFLVLETFSLSLANVKSDSSSTFAPGFRTQVLRIYSKSRLKAMIAKNKELAAVLAVDPASKINLDSVKLLSGQLDKLAMTGKVSLELAGALLTDPTGSRLKNLDINKSGVWANLSWAPTKFPLEFVGLARYAWTNNTVNNIKTSSRFAEFGAQTNYTTTKFSIEAEYLNRRDLYAAQNYSHLSASLTYHITDNLAAVAAYGKDLKVGEALTALFGINFGFERSK